MSARSRELFGLLPVTLLVTAGFTAVLITRSAQTGTVTITYGAIFLGCCLFAHIFIRIRLRTRTRTCSRWLRCSPRSGW